MFPAFQTSTWSAGLSRIGPTRFNTARLDQLRPPRLVGPRADGQQRRVVARSGSTVACGRSRARSPANGSESIRFLQKRGLEFFESCGLLGHCMIKMIEAHVGMLAASDCVVQREQFFFPAQQRSS